MKYLKNVRNVNYFKLMGAQCLKITKKLIQHCERSKLRLHFEWIKVNLKWRKMTKLVISNETFWNTSKHCDKEDEKSNSKRTTLLCHFYTLLRFMAEAPETSR